MEIKAILEDERLFYKVIEPLFIDMMNKWPMPGHNKQLYKIKQELEAHQWYLKYVSYIFKFERVSKVVRANLSECPHFAQYFLNAPICYHPNTYIITPSYWQGVWRTFSRGSLAMAKQCCADIRRIEERESRSRQKSKWWENH